jgi:hypothetical protein
MYNNAVVLEVERLDENYKTYTEVIEAHKIRQLNKEPYIPLEVIDRLTKMQNFGRKKEIDVTFYDFRDSNFNLIKFKQEREEKYKKLDEYFSKDNRRKK